MAKTINVKTEHQKEIIKLIKQASYRQNTYQVFNDFLEMSAIAISNSVDFTHREERENRYLQLINSYDKGHQGLFPLMFFHLTEALEEKYHTSGPEDVLGVIFHELELHNKYRGQFFTPQHISDFMAKLTCDSKSQNIVNEKGFITMCEPACGSGVMVTSFCKAMQEEGLNYHTQLAVTAVDSDLKCTHMAYLQLSLYEIPAVVIHGNSLSGEEWSRWYTPIYLRNGWIWRTSCGIKSQRCVEDEMIKCAAEPMYTALRSVEKLFAGNAPDIDAKPQNFTVSSKEPEKVFEYEEFKHLSFFDE